METKQIVPLEYEILSTTFQQSSENGNLYNQYVIRQKGDPFARTRKWNFFAEEVVLDSLEKNPPKSLWFAMVTVPTPEQYFSVWENDPGNGQEAGDYVSTKDAKGNWVPLLRNDLTVMMRWVNKTTPTNEDPEKLMMSAWNRGINRGSIVPASEADIQIDSPSDEPDETDDLLAQGNGEDADAATPPANPPAQQQQQRPNRPNFQNRR